MLDLEQIPLYDIEEYRIPEQEQTEVSEESSSNDVYTAEISVDSIKPILVNPETDFKGNYSLNAPLENKIEGVIQSIRNLYQNGDTPVIFASYGKDSSLLFQCATEALKDEIAAGNSNAKLVVASSMVGGSESIIMAEFMDYSINKAKEYAKQYNLPIEVRAIYPNHSENFMLQMLIGRSLAVYPGQKRSCSISMKKSPIERLKKQLKKAYPNQVGVLGTYYQESSFRWEMMAKRGERPDIVREDKDGRFLAPMAAFSADEVIEMVGRLSLCAMGVPTAFGKRTLTDTVVDFGRVVEIYTSTSNSSCSIEAIASEGIKGDTGCDSRTGCHYCVAISRDKSAENIVENTGNRAVKLLLDVRNAIKAAQFDLSKRTWLFKTVNDEGMIKFEPGSFSPIFIKSLFKFWLTIQAETGETLLKEDEILWIAANWDRYGIASSTECISIWHRIMKLGERYYPSEEDLIKAKPQPIPRGQYFKVVDKEFGEKKHGAFDENADFILKNFVNFKHTHKIDFIPELTSQLEQKGFSESESIHIVIRGGKHFDKLNLFQQHAYIEACQATIVKQETINRKLDNTKSNLPDKNGLDSIDAAFILYQFSEEFHRIYLENPNMSPSESYNVLSTKFGINMFNSGSMGDTERMLQRANLIFRLGMRPHLNDPEKLLDLLEKGSGYKLVQEVA